ncbi:MAG: hypothetical protein ACI9ZH_000405 [Paracoccaceae bacterium]|jgi:hypothetical protein
MKSAPVTAAKSRKTYHLRLGGLRVERPVQVRRTDITRLPMRRGLPVSGRQHGGKDAQGLG